MYSRDEVYELFPRLKERRRHLGSQLSGGERQMLGIGRALMMGPRGAAARRTVDRPGADAGLAGARDHAHAGARSGLAILLVEQNVRAAMEVVDRLVLLERGRVVMQGPTAQMGSDPRIARAYLGANAA